MNALVFLLWCWLLFWLAGPQECLVVLENALFPSGTLGNTDNVFVLGIVIAVMKDIHVTFL